MLELVIDRILLYIWLHWAFKRTQGVWECVVKQSITKLYALENYCIEVSGLFLHHLCAADANSHIKFPTKLNKIKKLGKKGTTTTRSLTLLWFLVKYSWVRKGALLYGTTAYNANLETYYKFRHSRGFSNPQLQFVSASGIFPCSNCSSSAGAGLATSESADAYCFPLVSAWAWCYVLFIRNLQL